MNRNHLSLWLTVIGSTLLFLSWCFQNFMQQDWKGDREALDRLRHRITTNDVLANIWYAAYKAQQAKPEIDLIPTASMGLQYINFSHHVRSAASRWLGNPESDMVQLSRSYVTQSESFRLAGNLLPILDLTEKARKLDESIAPTMAAAMDQKYRDIEGSEKLWERIFLGSYVIGALTVGASFLLSRLAPPEEKPKQLPRRKRGA